MKTIYFIRHGESQGNSGPLLQDGFSPLSDRGREQATFMANRCSRLSIETLVTSTMTRAQQTASIIAEKIGKGIVLSDLFTERRRPSTQIGKPKDDPEVLLIDKDIRNNFSTVGYKHSDEENFEDLRTRAQQALEFLAGRPEESIAVVTHGFFMRVVMAYIIFQEHLTGKECELFLRAFYIENTGLTVIKYAGADNESPWRVWTWNDHAHLG